MTPLVGLGVVKYSLPAWENLRLELSTNSQPTPDIGGAVSSEAQRNPNAEPDETDGCDLDATERDILPMLGGRHRADERADSRASGCSSCRQQQCVTPASLQSEEVILWQTGQKAKRRETEPPEDHTAGLSAFSRVGVSALAYLERVDRTQRQSDT